jgi:hypothetical protein
MGSRHLAVADLTLVQLDAFHKIDKKDLGACPRIENLLRKNPVSQISRSFLLNSTTIRLK